jgi:hypothetical protein
MEPFDRERLVSLHRIMLDSTQSRKVRTRAHLEFKYGSIGSWLCTPSIGGPLTEAERRGFLRNVHLLGVEPKDVVFVGKEGMTSVFSRTKATGWFVNARAACQVNGDLQPEYEGPLNEYP